jgi:hypothetical protein
VAAPAAAFDPHFDTGRVSTIAVDEPVVYLGGTFTAAGDSARSGLTAVNCWSGAPTPWNPAPNGSVSALVASGTTVYAGGNFTTLCGRVQPCLAAIVGGASADVPGPPAGSALALGPCVPTPVRGSARIVLTLPQAGPVSLALFDVQGRFVRTMLDGAWRAAGRQELALQTEGLATGLYFCRLEWMGMSLTRRVIMTR